MMRNYYAYRQKEYAEKVLLEGFQSAYVVYELKLLALYCRDELNMKPVAIKKRLTRFCQQYGHNYTLRGWCMTIKRAVDYAINKNHVLVQCNYVSIYRDELDFIESLDLGEDVKRTVLTMMVHKKLDKVSVEAQHGIDYAIFSYRTTGKRVKSIPRVGGLKRRMNFDLALDVFYPMTQAGLIEELRIKGSPFKLNFADKIVSEGEEVLKITDYENIGLYYDYLYHGGVCLCKVCGAPIKLNRKGVKRQYCDEHPRGTRKMRNVMKICEKCGDVFGAVPKNAEKQKQCYHCQPPRCLN